MATRSSCVQRPAAVGRAVLGAAARSERVLRGVVRIEEVEVRLGQDVAVVESGEGGGDGGGGEGGECEESGWVACLPMERVWHVLMGEPDILPRSQALAHTARCDVPPKQGICKSSNRGNTGCITGYYCTQEQEVSYI